MLFHNIEFSVFLAAVLLGLRAARGPAARKLLLAAANLVFLSWFSLPAAGLVAALVLVTYLLAGLTRSPRFGGAAFAGGVALLLLGIYAGRRLSGAGGYATPLETSAYALSFSFIAFPLIALLCDLRAGKRELPGFLDFLVFSTFFPTVSSGPVLRPDGFLPQLQGEAGDDPLRARIAVERFTIGLFKKTVLADRLGFLYQQLEAQAKAGAPCLFVVMLYVYALEVYFDFSGYTEMARGVARALGFEVPENFLRPYLAENPIDWWRRWHISLANFLRDYVYYPLFFRTKNLFFCTLVTFVLNGLWHGLALNFFFLGLYWAAAISFYLVAQSWWENLARGARIFLTLQIAVGSFVFFLPNGLAMLRAALSSAIPAADRLLALLYGLDGRNLVILALGIAIMGVARRRLDARTWRGYVPALYSIWLFLFTFGLFSSPANFIYSQF